MLFCLSQGSLIQESVISAIIGDSRDTKEGCPLLGPGALPQGHDRNVQSDVESQHPGLRPQVTPRRYIPVGNTCGGQGGPCEKAAFSPLPLS